MCSWLLCKAGGPALVIISPYILRRLNDEWTSCCFAESFVTVSSKVLDHSSCHYILGTPHPCRDINREFTRQ